MKHLLLLICTLASCSPIKTTLIRPDEQARRRILELESQLRDQTKSTDRWQLVTVSFGIGSVVLLVAGTALGAKTRHDATLS